MKIGLVTGEYPPMEGGVGAFTQELAKALAELGHEIMILTSREARPPDVQLTAKQLREPIDLGYAQLLARGRKWRWSDMAWIADAALRYELDVVNIQYQAAAYNMRSPAINFLPWRLRGLTKSVVTFHDLRTPYLFPKAGFLREWVVRRMAKSADSVITTNQADFEAVSGQRSAVSKKIPIGSNVKVHQVSAETIITTRQQLDLNDNDYLLGYFGFLNPSKGADLLIEALAQLPKNVHLIFIGGQTGASDPTTNDHFRTNLQSLISNLNLTARIHWTGFLDDKAVSAHLKSCTAIVLPYRDGVSLRRGTLMAALAHGCPIVTTQPLDPVPELQHGENCYLVPPEDVGALTDGIRDVLVDGEKRTIIGNGAEQLAQRFTWDKIAHQTASLFTQLQ